jgi:hypothetical protein
VKRAGWLAVGLAIALLMSLGLNAWLSFQLMDQAALADDQTTGQQNRGETITALRWLADRYGNYPARGEVEAHMKVRFPEPGHVVKWEGDTLWVDEVGFHYVGDSLGTIVLMNEPAIASEVK